MAIFPVNVAQPVAVFFRLGEQLCLPLIADIPWWRNWGWITVMHWNWDVR